jgi:phospholipid/cholesterol/gamma-HCH transport system ATP-binding protein
MAHHRHRNARLGARVLIYKTWYKRVALARALALDPAIVFLDKPKSGLNPIATREFGVLIRALQRTLGLTVFMVTHDVHALSAIWSMPQALGSADSSVKSYFRDVRSASARGPATP